MAGIIFGAAQASTASTTLELMGLEPARRLHAVTTDAVVLVNVLLNRDSPVRLVFGAQEPDDDSIRVHLVRPEGFGKEKVAEARQNCRCIIIGNDGFENFHRAHSQTMDQMLEIDRSALLSFVLLHEIGHIVRGHRGSFWDGYAVSPERLNTTSSSSKGVEKEADDFVSAQLISASEATGDFQRWMAGASIQTALAKLSWNLSVRRRLAHFGGSVLRDPRLFFDIGQSHPNFELRVLELNYEVLPSADAMALLDEFHEARMARDPTTLD